MKDVKIVVLIKEDEVGENESLNLAMNGVVFDFLKHPVDDISIKQKNEV